MYAKLVDVWIIFLTSLTNRLPIRLGFPSLISLMPTMSSLNDSTVTILHFRNLPLTCCNQNIALLTPFPLLQILQLLPLFHPMILSLYPLIPSLLSIPNILPINHLQLPLLGLTVNPNHATYTASPNLSPLISLWGLRHPKEGVVLWGWTLSLYPNLKLPTSLSFMFKLSSFICKLVIWTYITRQSRRI